MERREFLQTLAGGAVACSISLAGCKSLCGKGGAGCAPCGRDCGSCPAKAKGQCEGCRADDDKMKNPGCQIRACATKKAVRTCAECRGFPCPKLQAWAGKNDTNKAAFERLQALAGK